jgi:hypothetical protein
VHPDFVRHSDARGDLQGGQELITSATLAPGAEVFLCLVLLPALAAVIAWRRS